MMKYIMMNLLIDGYNLLYIIESGLIGSLQEKREALLKKLHRYQIEKNVNVTVVFDSSYDDPSLLKNDKLGNVRIVFTDRNRSADEWIKEACRKMPAGYVVVSSDHEIISFVEAHGC